MLVPLNWSWHSSYYQFLDGQNFCYKHLMQYWLAIVRLLFQYDILQCKSNSKVSGLTVTLHKKVHCNVYKAMYKCDLFYQLSHETCILIMANTLVLLIILIHMTNNDIHVYGNLYCLNVYMYIYVYITNLKQRRM